MLCFPAVARGEDSVDELLVKVGSKDKKVYDAAFAKFKAMGKRAVPALEKALKDPNARTRQNAVSALGQIGDDARSASPAVAALMSDKDADVRAEALNSLDYIMNFDDLMPFVRRGLKDESAAVREQACDKLFRNGKIAGAYVGLMLDALKDRDKTVRRAAASALGEIGAVNKQVVPALIAMLKDADEWVRSTAADALGEIGPVAKEAIPALTDLSKTNHAAAEALKKINANVKKVKEPAPLSPAAKLAEQWKKVDVEMKPSSSVVKFEFTPDKDGVRWKASVGEGIVDYKAYDIYFYENNTRIGESIEILKKMKRNTALEGSTTLDPTRVTRIEVRLRQ
jgi:HEAT repeat protein